MRHHMHIYTYIRIQSYSGGDALIYVYICIYVYVYVLGAYVMVRRAAPPHMARTRDGEHDDDDAYAVCVFVCDRS